MPRNNIGDSNKGNGTPAAIAPRPGHRIREIRQELHHRHHTLARYQVTNPASHPPTGRAPVVSVTSDEYQALLYARSRGTNPRDRLAAVREAIATSPYTWEDLAADGVKEWVEESIEDDVLLAAAVESLGSLGIDERPYLGKFAVERIYEILTTAEAAYWRRAVPFPDLYRLLVDLRVGFLQIATRHAGRRKGGRAWLLAKFCLDGFDRLSCEIPVSNGVSIRAEGSPNSPTLHFDTANSLDIPGLKQPCTTFRALVLRLPILHDSPGACGRRSTEHRTPDGHVEGRTLGQT